MRKILLSAIILASFQTYSLAACCCVPGVSCVVVEKTVEEAKQTSLKNVQFNDNKMGENWISKVESELKEINKLKEVSQETQENILSMEFANLIESYNEEMLYTSLLEYQKTSFDEDAINNKLLLLEANIDATLKQLTLNSNSEIPVDSKK